MTWTAEEDLLLTRSYSNMEALPLCILFGRGWNAIRARASFLKLKRAKYFFPTGKDNPKYKDGRANAISICGCGKEKDNRAIECIDCRSYQYCKKDLESIVKESKSFDEVARKLNASRTSTTRFIRRYQLNISHFRPGRNRPTEIEKFLTIDNKPRSGTIKRIVLKNNLLDYRCLWCKIGNLWNGLELILQLDHINGNPCDNRLENLRFLCPNCHSQTETYTGKNLRGKNRVHNQTK